MNRIAEEVETDATYRSIIHAQRSEPEANRRRRDRRMRRARSPRRSICPRPSAGPFSGSTALRVARERPKSPIVAISPNVETGTQARGRAGACIASSPRMRATSTTWWTALAGSRSVKASQGRAAHHHRGGVPLGTPGATNMVRIAFVGSETDED
jgi:pyruvate kinase